MARWVSAVIAATRLVEAARDAARVTALAEAAAFLQQAVQLDPRPATYLELAATRAQLGDRAGSDDAFQARPATHRRRPRPRRGVVQEQPVRPDERARERPPRAPRRVADLDTRVELLLVRAWAEVVAIGANAAYMTLAEVEALGVDLTRDPLRVHHIENVRGFIALAEGRLEEAERALVASGEAAERAGRPDFAYGGWANASCVATAAHAHERALVRRARRPAGHVAAGDRVPGLLPAGGRARTAGPARRGAVGERAPNGARRPPRLAELRAMADHDSGLIALQAGDFERAASLLHNALEQRPPIQRADTRLRRAEALARLGRADDADAEIRAATQEPVRPADRPAVLVARMTFAQALSARARGRHDLADRRLREC